MARFDTFVMVDWSAGKRAPKRPSKDAIWIGVARDGRAEAPRYMRSRVEAEAELIRLLDAEGAAGRRVLVGFDFPFGYPKGVARAVAGADDPFALWDWLAARIEDGADGSNNRYAVAEEMNACFPGAGPFWGKPREGDHPGVPFRKAGIAFDLVEEFRACDRVTKAASSCFQLAFPPTVGGQALMGLPVVNRLRRRAGVSVWPFQDCDGAGVVLAEIWPGLIEPAVKTAMSPEDIRDAVQVRLLSSAFSRLEAERLAGLMADLPEAAREEAWILGANAGPELSALALAPPPLANDCFALPPGVDWTPVSEALARLKTRLRPVVGREAVALEQALGRVLAEDLPARRANPPHANAAVDGYGFAGDAAPGSCRLQLLPGRAAAGQGYAGEVGPGQAVRILTGAPLPAGVDTIVLQEDVTVTAETVVFEGPLKPGANTRRAGEDFSVGDIVVPAGHALRAPDIALAAAAGFGRLPVHQRLTVAVLSTGDELVPPDGGDGTVDANGPMLGTLVRAWGHELVDLGRAPDDAGAIRAALDRGAAEADVILTSGGASAGDEDHISALLRAEGDLTAWRIALKPGRPLALALWGGVPVFGFPGNPVAALVCALIFARPALSVLAGSGWIEPLRMTVAAGFSKRKKAGRSEYLRARLRADGRADVFASEGSGRISGLSWAEGLVELGPDAREITPGEMVTFLPYAGFGV